MEYKPEITLVSGFLGAGKTTFIKRLLNGVFHAGQTVVLENEFGETDIDGEALRRRGISSVSVKAGCICCTGAGDFLSSISEIFEKFSPDKIIIEPTGFAKLSELMIQFKASPLRGACELKTVVTIVNAAGFNKRMLISKEFFEDQIANSGMIFLSRAGELPLWEINEIERKIHGIRQDCKIISENWDEIPDLRLSEMLLQAKPSDRDAGTGGHAHADFCGIHTSSWVDLSPRTEQFANKLAAALKNGELGEILRVKGWLLLDGGKAHTVDYTPGEFVLGDEVPSDRTELCFIGKNIDGRRLREIFI